MRAWSRLGRGSRIALIAGFVAVVLLATRTSRTPEPRSTAREPLVAPLTHQAKEEHALALQSAGDYPAAEKLFRECLAEREQMLGAAHIDTLAAMNNLANLLNARGQNAEALALNKQCLAVREKTLGADHPHTLASLNNLAMVLRDNGDFAEAEALYRRGWEGAKRVSGPEHPDTLSLLNNLANVLSDMGEYEKADPLYRQLIQATESKFGSENPTTLAAHGNLANLLLRKGDYISAGPIYLRCLEIRQRVQGAEHPETLLAMSNLAAYRLESGAHAEAEALYRQCLASREKVLGRMHPETLATMNNLASALRERGAFTESEKMARASIEAHEQALGAAHPETFSSVATLADVLRDKGESGAAVPLYERALDGLRRSPGAVHPTTLAVIYEYSLLRKNQRDLPAARRLGYELVAGARRSLPPLHRESKEVRASRRFLTLTPFPPLPPVRPCLESACRSHCRATRGAICTGDSMKVKPCLFLFFTCFALLAVGLAPCEGALLLYYDFNDGAEAAVTDVSGNGHAGSFNGAPVYTAPGMGYNNTPGRSMEFNGFGDRIQVDDGATAFDSLTTTGATSIAFWILGDTLGDPRPGFPVTNFSAFNGAGARELMAHVPWEDGTVYFDVGGGAGPGVNRIFRDATADQFEGGWDHWIFTKEGSGTQGVSSIYVNNTLFHSAPTTATFGDIENFFVGGNGQNSGEGYLGLMDEFAVWDHALSAEERTRVFNGTVIPEPSSAALLIAGFLLACGRTARRRRA